MLVDFDPLCQFLYFCGEPVVAIVMIDSSRTRKSLVWVEVQSPYVIGRCSREIRSVNHATLHVLLHSCSINYLTKNLSII